MDTSSYTNPMQKRLIAQKPYSLHPGDKHLTVVLCEIGGHMPFVTWIRNNEAKGDDSGHYYSTLAEALFDFESRGRGVKI